MLLRNYQLKVIDYFNSNSDDCVFCLPTGTGKSVIITAIIKQYLQRGEKVGVVVPSIELLHNIRNYYVVNRSENIIQLMSDKEIRQDKHIYLGVYKSFESKKDKLPKLSLMIHDECHHSAAKTWFSLMGIADRDIGFSATPTRLDGAKLPFTKIYEPYPISWYMQQGYLCSEIEEYVGNKIINAKESSIDDLADQWSQAKKYIHGEAVKDWLKYKNGKTIVFCTTIEHCQEMLLQYREITTAEIVHSKQTLKTRKDIFDRFQHGDINVLLNVNVVCEGVNIPDCSTVQFLRFFGSIAGYVQAVGRALRPAKDKKVVVIDNAGVLTHGSVKYLNSWSDLFYENLNNEEIEIIVKELTKIGIPTPKFIKPQGSDGLVRYTITAYDEAVIKAVRITTGKRMIAHWKSYIKNNDPLTFRQLNDVLKICSLVMSKVKAARILGQYMDKLSSEIINDLKL